ncbi:MAG: metallophosphoesterase [Verrucomicrobiota bacterium]
MKTIFVRHFGAIAAVWLLSMSPSQAESPAGESPEQGEAFSHRVPTEQKPWTRRSFLDDPKDFQFAIVSDRTGGMRRGVFPEAVRKVNELQPEFVMTVGDLIPGGTRLRDEKEILRQWDEFNDIVDGFEMPFFYLPGNHDVSNELMDRIWDEKYGARYYSFVYKDVLFLCLNTQGGEGTRPILGEEQISWVKKELEEVDDVRWTLVFVHQPIWVYEEGTTRYVDGEPVLRKSRTGWSEIEATLAGRNYTVYAGHVHRYAKYERNEANYYTLGTTGGGSARRGSAYGEFDHVTWITMTDEGPRMMNLTLEGMLPEDITSEAQQEFWRGLRFSENYHETFPFQEKTLTLPIENPLDTPLAGQLSWILPVSDQWTVSPRRISVDLAPGEKTEVQFSIGHQGDVSTYFPMPRLETHFHSEASGYHLERALYLPLDLTEHVKQYPNRATMSATKAMFSIDGRLDEEDWKVEPTISRLIPRQADGYAPVETEAWLTYDERFLYVGIRCYEPLLRDVWSESTNRDSELAGDDFVEVLFDTNLDKKSFHQFAVNPEGTFLDARRDDVSWNSTAQIATDAEEDAWTVEIAIPLEEIDADLEAHSNWGLQMGRHRPRMGEKRSYQWSPTFWYGNTVPSFFGVLNVK